MRKKLIISVSCVLAVIIAACTVLGFYAGNYYHASADALSYMSEATIIDNKYAVFAPESVQAGLVFYPAGKVDYSAYAQLMCGLRDRGVLCVLVRMPLNLAVLDSDAAAKASDKFPDIDSWYVAGHSLGGAMAASYAANNPDELDGLIMLAACSTADLSDSGLDVLSVYGSCDGVLDSENYRKCLSNLPENASELEINGGCHSFFGDYGMQSGDGTPTVTLTEQLKQTEDAIIELMQLDT